MNIIVKKDEQLIAHIKYTENDVRIIKAINNICGGTIIIQNEEFFILHDDKDNIIAITNKSGTQYLRKGYYVEQ